MQMKQFRQRRAYPGARLQVNLGLGGGTQSRKCFQQLIPPGKVSAAVLFQQQRPRCLLQGCACLYRQEGPGMT